MPVWTCRSEQRKNKTFRRKPNNWRQSCRPSKRGWNACTPQKRRRGGLALPPLRQTARQQREVNSSPGPEHGPKGAGVHLSSGCPAGARCSSGTKEVSQRLREQLGLLCSLVGEPAGLEVLACSMRLSRRLGASQMDWASPPVLVAALLCIAMTLAGPPGELRRELREAIAGPLATGATLAAEAQLIQAMGRVDCKLGVCGPNF